VAQPIGPLVHFGPPLVSRLFSLSDVLVMSVLDAIKGYVLLCFFVMFSTHFVVIHLT